MFEIIYLNDMYKLIATNFTLKLLYILVNVAIVRIKYKFTVQIKFLTEK